jgi:hypothetical protein
VATSPASTATQSYGGIQPAVYRNCGFGDDDPAWAHCLDSEAALDPMSCNEVCQSNTFKIHCTQAASPYCRTYQYPSGVRDYRCAGSRETGPMSVQHTFNGQTDRVLITSILGWGDFFGAGMLPTTESLSSRSASTSTTSLAEQTTSPAAAAQGSSVPVEATVESVIGGIAMNLRVCTRCLCLCVPPQKECFVARERESSVFGGQARAFWGGWSLGDSAYRGRTNQEGTLTWGAWCFGAMRGGNTFER